MTIHSVANASELTTALGSASGGDTIECAAGSYGAYNFSDYVFASDVTITSADPGNMAVFNNLDIDDASHIVIDGLRIEGSGGKIVEIDLGDNITITNCVILGPNAGVAPNSSDYAIYATGTDDLTISNNDVQWCGVGPTAFGGVGVVVSGNFVDHVYTDCYKFGGNNGLLLENNIGGGNGHAPSGPHMDFVQIQAGTTNTTIRNNLFLAQNDSRPQGIYLGSDDDHTNVLIENNIICSGKNNAIKVNNGYNITARYNTCLTTRDTEQTAALVNLPSGNTSEYNIYSVENGGGYSGTNLALQYSDSGGDYYYNDYYADAMAGLGMQVEDLAPVEGSAAETIGAFALIAELLGSSEPPSVPATITVAVTVGA